MSVSTDKSHRPPRVCLIGQYEHPDFRDAVAVLRADADLTLDTDVRVCPELIVVAHSRPGVIGQHRVEQLRRAAPLAGVVSLLGSWCEGQARSGRPTHDALRLYWHEFAPWWRRQLALRAAGRCPDWARPDSAAFQSPPIRNPQSEIRNPTRGVIVVHTPRWETADALADVLQRADYASVWQPPGRSTPAIRGAAAGIWEGGQLDDREAEDLARFCRRLARDSAAVIALLDFPRRDRCEVAHRAGAAIILGKPWPNADLVATLSSMACECQSSHAA